MPPGRLPATSAASAVSKRLRSSWFKRKLIVSMPTKTCTKCEQPKELEEFARLSKVKDGRRSVCRSCASTYRKSYYLRHANEEKQRSADVRKQSPELVTARRRNWKQAHRDQVRGYEKDYLQQPLAKQKRAARFSRWSHANLELRAVANARRRASKRNASGSHTAREWRVLKEFFGFRCLRCHRHESETGTLHRDHVMPLLLGGSNDIGNLQPLCRSCNAWKGARYIDFRLPEQVQEIEVKLVEPQRP